MAKANDSRLGRGIGAMFGADLPKVDELRKPIGYVNKEIISQASPRQSSSDVFRIPASQIVPNPFQPRKSFNQESLMELSSSIRTLGLIQPITVRRISEDNYQIISGERRYRACCLAGMDMIPAYVRDTNDKGMLEMAIVENVQRENLDPIEIAMSYQRLIDECSLTQEEMAGRVGKKRTSVTNYLRLLKLPAKIQHDLKVGLLSVGHAKVLLGVEDPILQEKLCDLSLSQDFSVRQLEEKIKTLRKDQFTPDKGLMVEPALPESYDVLSERLGRYFKNSISFKRTNSGKGSMTVKFESDEEVDMFLSVLDKIES